MGVAVVVVVKDKYKGMLGIGHLYPGKFSRSYLVYLKRT